MLKKSLKTLVTLTLLSSVTGCAGTPKLDMKRFSEAKELLNKMPKQASCSVIPSTMHQVDLPTDTSGGVFKSLADVGKQDAAAAAHYPVLSNRFTLLSDTVKENEATDKLNATDVDDAIARLKEVFDKILKEEQKRGWFK